nr:accessory factor UbiK family protein [Uliginosibacterium gangwonense]
MVSPVSPAKIFEELGNKVSELLATTPAKDMEKNIKAMLSGAFAKLDLVSREEFEVQRELLARTRERLEALEKKLAEAEKHTGGGD